MQKGDTVWLEVSRDKERLVTVIAQSGEWLEVIDENGKSILAHNSELRQTKVLTTKNATKNDSTKVRMELVPAAAVEALGRAMTYGSKKYSDHNWANGFEWDRLVGSLMRHLNSWRSGEDNDPESGLSHIDHVLANAAMLAAHIEENLGNDNRRKTKS